MDHTPQITLLREQYLCAITMYMEQCVMISGMNLRPELSADNSDSLQQAVSCSSDP